MTELKPCPFCGGEAEMHSGWTEGGDAFAVVYCKQRTSSDLCAEVWVERSTLKTAEKDARAMWNRRTQ